MGTTTNPTTAYNTTAATTADRQLSGFQDRNQDAKPAMSLPLFSCGTTE
jgi:hypothetical protein